MKGKFLILSLKHSEGRTPTFWRPDNAGYTIFPWAAGIYDQADIDRDPGYYNDGFNSLAVELTNDGLESIGFECQMDLNKVDKASKKAILQRKEAEK